jgi:hypothetical protein
VERIAGIKPDGGLIIGNGFLDLVQLIMSLAAIVMSKCIVRRQLTCSFPIRVGNNNRVHLSWLKKIVFCDYVT